MHGFVAHYTNKVDAKGRVSIPAAYRQVLARDGYEGLYCFASPHAATVDAGGNQLLDEITKQLKKLPPLSLEHDMLSQAFFGDSEQLKVDGEGRIALTETIRDATGITGTAMFVGLGYKFQIWEPGAFKEQRAKARQRAFSVLGAGASGESAG